MSRRSVSPSMTTRDEPVYQQIGRNKPEAPPRRRKRGKSLSVTRLTQMGSSYESDGEQYGNSLYANQPMLQNTFGYDRDAAAFSYYSAYLRPQLKRYISSDITYSIPTPPAMMMYDENSVINSGAPPLPPRIAVNNSMSNLPVMSQMSTPTPKPPPPPLPPRPALGLIPVQNIQNASVPAGISRDKSNSNMKLWKVDDHGNFIKYYPNKQHRGSLSTLTTMSEKEKAYQKLAEEVHEKYFKTRASSTTDMNVRITTTKLINPLNRTPVKSVTSKIFSSISRGASRDKLYQTIMTQQQQLASLTQQQNYLQAQVLWQSTHSPVHGSHPTGESPAISTRSGRSNVSTPSAMEETSLSVSRSSRHHHNHHHHHHNQTSTDEDVQRDQDHLHQQHSLENRIRKCKSSSRGKIQEQIALQQTQVAQHILQLQEQLQILKERKRIRDEKVNGSTNAKMSDGNDTSNFLVVAHIDRPERPKTPEPSQRDPFMKRIRSEEESFESELAGDEEDDPKSWFAREKKPTTSADVANETFGGRKGSFKPIHDSASSVTSKITRKHSDGFEHFGDDLNFEVEEDELIPFADENSKEGVWVFQKIQVDSNNNDQQMDDYSDEDYEMLIARREAEKREKEEEQQLLEEIRREEEEKQVMLIQQNVQLEQEILLKKQEKERLEKDEEERLKVMQSSFMAKAEEEMLRQQQEFMNQQMLLLEQQQKLEQQREELQKQQQEFLETQELMKQQPNRPQRLPRRPTDDSNIGSLENLKQPSSNLMTKPPAFPDTRPPPRPMSPQQKEPVNQHTLNPVNQQNIRREPSPIPSTVPPASAQPMHSPVKPAQESLQIPGQSSNLSPRRSPSPSVIQPTPNQPKPQAAHRPRSPFKSGSVPSDTFMDHFDHYFMPTSSTTPSRASVTFNTNVRGRYISRGNSRETELSFRSESKSPEHLANLDSNQPSNTGSQIFQTFSPTFADDTLLSSTANKIRHLQKSGDPLSSVRGLSPLDSRRQTLPDVIKALDIDSPSTVGTASPVSKSFEAPVSTVKKTATIDSRKKSVFAENPLQGPPEGWDREKVSELAHAAREAKILSDSQPPSMVDWSSVGSWFWDKKLGFVVLLINLSIAYYFYSLIFDPSLFDQSYSQTPAKKQLLKADIYE